ncbi:MAG: hypothetical protein OXI58_11960, partial [Gemmatimonadota bacterium]|nr:hypothetical protein [Gemmatimonadota bacterium]
TGDEGHHHRTATLNYFPHGYCSLFFEFYLSRQALTKALAYFNYIGFSTVWDLYECRPMI